MFAEDITSANIVGYTSPACNSGWKIYGTQFQGVTAGTAEINIQDYVKIGDDATKVYYDEDLTFQGKAPHLQIPNRTVPGGQAEMYYYLQDPWYLGPDGEDDWRNDKPGWANGDGIRVEDVTITPGMAFWIKNQQTDNENFSVTLPGQVPNLTASFDNTTPGGGLWFLASSAFPNGLFINSPLVEVSNAPEVYYDEDLTFQGKALHLQIPNRTNPNGQAEMYYYLQNPWYLGPDGEEDWRNDKPGFADGDGMLVVDTAATLPVGTGFWLKSSAQSTLTYSGSAD